MKVRIKLVLCAIALLMMTGVISTGSEVEAATSYTLGNTENGYIYDEWGETIYYEFYVPESGKLSLDLSIRNITSLYCDIYDSSDKDIFDESVDTGSTSLKGSVEVTSGRYRLVLHGYSQGSYSFCITHTASDESFKDDLSDDMISGANGIKLDTLYRGHMARNEDRDSYKFDLDNSGTINLDITTEFTYFMLYIYDENEKKIYSKSECGSEATSKNVFSEKINLVAGRYTLVIEKAYASETGDYEFSMPYNDSRESFPESTTTLYNNMTLAPEIEIGKTYRGQTAINDQMDIYKFTASGSVTLSYESDINDSYAEKCKVLNSSGEEMAYLYVDYIEALGKSIISYYDDEDKEIRLSAGTYYLQIESESPYSTYEFTMTKYTGSTSSTPDTEYEDPDTSAGKEKNTIVASSEKVTVGTYKNLNAYADGYVNLLYQSSNVSIVKVNSSGYISAVGCGKATITITATADSTYKKTTKKITITVVPKKAKIKSLKSPKKKMFKCTWGKLSKITGYQVEINSKNLVWSKKTSLTGRVSRGKKATVRVRAYKIVKGTKYFGAWSSKKSVKLK